MVPLADPIMSLIDTVALGRYTDMLQLAALGPCSLIFSFSNYVWAGLSVATVTLVAERLRSSSLSSGSSSGIGTSGKSKKINRPASHILTTALAVAVLGGAAVTAILLSYPEAILRATGADASLLAAASGYLRVRALAAPAAVVIQVGLAGWRYVQLSLLRVRKGRASLSFPTSAPPCALQLRHPGAAPHTRPAGCTSCPPSPA
jgi:Na+-driven multidrug efflux pump